MSPATNRFLVLGADEIKGAHYALCVHALRAWQVAAVSALPRTPADTHEHFDVDLPAAALAAIRAGADREQVAQRYQAPIATLQDCDLDLPERSLFAYYAIYNCFRKYVRGEPVDDWLIVNQVIAALGDAAVTESLLHDVAGAADRIDAG